MLLLFELELVLFGVDVRNVPVHKLTVLKLLVKAEARPLLEFLLAARVITGVWMILGVSVYMFRQILLLCKVATADVADEALEPHVQGDQMSFQAEAGAERLATVGHGTDIGVLVS